MLLLATNLVVDEYRQLNDQKLEKIAATSAFWSNQGRQTLDYQQAGLERAAQQTEQVARDEIERPVTDSATKI